MSTTLQNFDKEAYYHTRAKMLSNNNDKVSSGFISPWKLLDPALFQERRLSVAGVLGCHCAGDSRSFGGVWPNSGVAYNSCCLRRGADWSGFTSPWKSSWVLIFRLEDSVWLEILFGGAPSRLLTLCEVFGPTQEWPVIRAV
jgi:hypothetical protein